MGDRQQSDRDFSADPPETMTREGAVRLMEQSDIAELFDQAAMERFGRWISAARLGIVKRRRR